ncbi:MAG TPA: response regulator [Herbaspirillum sp.]|uniref:response regulator n=1 Tax=Herbaspirillum sp. TaxID=1890675 RepID=UPI002D338A4D|nr:response regulator [Herbaspirillum sp.]HZG21664.1 response regulator [Herbaspirillum sp.]
MNFPSIVMIDPSQEAVELARFALWRAGLHCAFRSCPDASSARRCLLQGRRSGDGVAPCLILLESDMGCCDGLELLRELRASKHLSQAPVVVFPSRDTEGEQAALAAGASHYQPKPVDGEHYARCVVEMVQRWCDAHAAREPLAATVMREVRQGLAPHPARRHDDPPRPEGDTVH